MENSDRAGKRLGSNTSSYIYGIGGNLGISTTSPTAKLEVNGNIVADGFLDSYNQNFRCIPTRSSLFNNKK
jgi:hypothetical protein